MGNANMGSDFDKWLMAEYYSGYYVAMNAIPSTATIIAGVMCGRLIASSLPQKRIMLILAISGIASMLAGLALCPLVPIINGDEFHRHLRHLPALPRLDQQCDHDLQSAACGGYGSVRRCAPSTPCPRCDLVCPLFLLQKEDIL